MEPEQPSKQFKLNTEIITYAGSAAAGASGVAALWASIRSNFYKNMAKLGKYNVLQEARLNTEKGVEAGLGDIKEFEEVKGYKDLKGFKGVEGLKGEALIEAHNKINRAYSRGVDKIHADMEITKTFQKFKMLTHTQKIRVIGAAVATSTVAVGAIVNINHKRQVAEELRELNARNQNSAGAAAV